jgi:hypothetical protein
LQQLKQIATTQANCNNSMGKSDLKILLQLYPEKPWSIPGILSNPNIDLDFVVSRDDMFDWVGWNVRELSRNPTLTIKQIKENMIMWNFAGLSSNPHLTVKLLDKYEGTCKLAIQLTF